MDFPLTRSVPLPPVRRPYQRNNYPFRQMQPGDSFFVPGLKPREIGGSMVYARKSTGFAFVTKSERGGTRVWRSA